MNYYSSLKTSQIDSPDALAMWKLMDELQQHVLGMAVDKRWNAKYDALLQSRASSQDFESFANNSTNRGIAMDLIKKAR